MDRHSEIQQTMGEVNAEMERARSRVRNGFYPRATYPAFFLYCEGNVKS
jgi:hypothetical protein